MDLLVFNFWIWYQFENILQILVPLVVEYKYYKTGHFWNLEESGYFGVLIGGLIWTAFILIGWVGLMVVLFWKFIRLDEHSKMITLKDGLYQRNRCSFIFYFDYFLYRIIISILVGLTTVLGSNTLFAIALSWQVFFMILKIRKVFENCKTTFLVMLAELLVTVTLVYCFVAYK